MPILHDVNEVRVVGQDVLDVSSQRVCACLDSPEGNVEMRPSQGRIHSPRFIDGWEVLAPHAEALVVLDQLLFALLAFDLHTDTNLRPVATEPLGLEGFQPLMHMRYIRRCTIPVQTGHDEAPRFNLLGLWENCPSAHRLVHSMRKFAPFCQCRRAPPRPSALRSSSFPEGHEVHKDRGR